MSGMHGISACVIGPPIQTPVDGQRERSPIHPSIHPSILTPPQCIEYNIFPSHHTHTHTHQAGTAAAATAATCKRGQGKKPECGGGGKKKKKRGSESTDRQRWWWLCHFFFLLIHLLFPSSSSSSLPPSPQLTRIPFPSPLPPPLPPPKKMNWGWFVKKRNTALFN